MDAENQKQKASGKTHKIRVGTKNFLSQIFFVWVFRFIFRLRRDKSDFKNIDLNLCDTETCVYNDDILEKWWKDEKQKAANENR